MIISIIVAIADNRAIGIKNSLPWKLPADLEYFKKNTLGKTIVMGLRTFESIGGKPLPGRKTIILNNEPGYKAPEGCLVARSIGELIEMTKECDEVMICGGSMVYKQFLPIANRLYITFIHHEFEADTFFPEIDFSPYKEVKRTDRPADKDNIYDMSFVVYEKNI